MKTKKVISLLSIALVLLLVACSGDSDGKNTGSTNDKEIVVAVTGEANSLDPHNESNTASRHIYSVLTETLVTWDEDGEIIPLLAKDWDMSDDGQVWTFQLEEGVEFHDGTPFNAEAVKVNFDRVTNEEEKLSQYSVLGPHLESVETNGDHEVIFNLNEPVGPFLNILAFPTGTSIISPKSIEEGNESVERNPVGTSPYKLDNWSPGSDTTFVAFDNYWGEEPQVEKITFQYIQENATRVIMLETGEVDIIHDVPASDIDRFEEDDEINVKTTDLNRTLYVGINNEFDLFDNKEVRQALNYAVNKESLSNELYDGLVRPSTAAVSEKNNLYSNVGGYDYDMEKAKQLIKDSGIDPGSKKVRLIAAGNVTRDHRAGEYVQSSLQELGFDVELQLLELNQYLEALDNPGDYELFLRGGISNTYDVSFVLNDALLSTSDNNYALYSNPKVDDLINDGFVEFDEVKREEIYKDSLEQIKEDAPWIFLYEDSNSVGIHKDVEGLLIHPNTLWSFSNISKK